MATKKTIDPNDYTEQPQAMTQEDVNNQDSRTRLWQSLGYSYGNQIKESNKSYDKAISQQDNAMLARGMQRSSYGDQIRANMYNDKMNAENNIRSAWIADYQNRIGDIEAKEKEDERWQQEFDYKKEQDTLSQQNWESQFGYQKERDAIQDAFQQQQWQAQQEQWREEFDYNKMSNDQKIAFEAVATAASNGGDVSDDILAKVGLTRQDYNAMKKQAAKGGGGGRYANPATTGANGAATGAADSYAAFLESLGGNPQTPATNNGGDDDRISMRGLMLSALR